MKALYLPGFFCVDADANANDAAADADDALDLLGRSGVSLSRCSLTTLAAGGLDQAVQEVQERCADVDVAIGYSMGARLLLLALAAGASPRAAVLVSLSSSPASPKERALRLSLDQERATELEHDAAAFTRSWGALPLFATAHQSLGWQQLQRRRSTLNQAQARAHAHSLRVLSPGAMPVPDLASLQARGCPPLLLLAGAQDPAAVERARATLAVLPGAELALIEGASHVLPLQAPAQLCALLQSFMSRRIHVHSNAA